MKTALALVMAATAALWAPQAGHCAALTVVNVSAPALNCVFDKSCKVAVDDTNGTLQFTPFGSGALLQSRTYPGAAGTPGAGTTAYLYRVDLTQGTKFTECLVGLVLNFGPVVQLTYPTNQPGQVFVVTQGGLGSVGLKSAEQDGTVITFTFSTPLCAGQSSDFFGLAAAKGPQQATATLFGFGNPPFVATTARTPQH